MTRLRIGFALSLIIGSIYAAGGLLTSLAQFGIGLAICCLAIIGYGLCDFIETNHDERVAQAREAVWARRDNE